MTQFAPMLAILGGILLLFGGGDTPGPRPNGDAVAKAFDTYETLWRKHNADAAGKLRSAEITDDTEIREFIAAGQEPMRRVAFEAIAKAEGEALKKWTAEKHAEILEGYSE